MTCILTDNQVFQLFEDLGKLVTGLYKQTKAFLAIEIGEVAKQLEEQGFEGALSTADLFTNQIQDFNATLASNQAFNPSDLAAASDQYANLLGTLLGQPPVVPQSGDPLEAFDSPFKSCGSQTTAGGIVTGIVNNQVNKLTNTFKAVTSSFGVLLAQESNLAGAVFYNAIKNYVVKSTAQNLLLKQVKDTVEEINEDLVKLEEDDYRINHGVTLSAAIVELSAADNLLRTQADNIGRNFRSNTSGPRSRLNMQGYDKAIERIEAVADLLCGIDVQDIVGGFLSETVIKITARLVYIEELFKLLKETDEELVEIQLNLSQFDNVFQDLTFFDDAFLPVIGMARCRLSVVMADMQSTINANNLGTYVLKEKLWCLELKVLGGILKASKVFDVDFNDGPLSLDGVDDVLNELFEGVKTQDQVISIDSIELALDRYVKNVRYKLSYNVDPTSTISRGELVNRLVDQRIEENESFGLFVSNKSLTAEQALSGALGVLGGFFQAIKSVAGMGAMVTGLQNGDLAGVVNGDLLTKAIESVFNLLVAQINAQLARIGCTLQDIDHNSLKAYEVVQDEARSQAMFNDADSGFPEDVLRESVQGDLARLDIKDV